MNGSLTYSLIRIDSFIRPQLSEVFWSTTLLPFFNLAMDNRSASSCCSSTLIASNCDHSDRAMQLLLCSLCILFMLVMIGSQMYFMLPSASAQPVPIIVHENAHFICVHKKKQNDNITSFLLLYIDDNEIQSSQHLLQLQCLLTLRY